MADMVMNFAGKTSDTCDSVAGYISFAYSIKSLALHVVVILIAFLISSVTEGSTRIQTSIDSVLPDTHVQHEFTDIAITSRKEERSRRVRRGDQTVTEKYHVTVYDVSNFISPNGSTMNSLIGLTRRPQSSRFPVRLNNGSVDGGTVEPQTKYWNRCTTTLDHKGKKYTDVLRPHDAACSALIGIPWDVYLTSDGTIETHNAGAFVKVIAQIVLLLSTTQIVHEVVKMYFLLSNGFYSDYKLPEIFTSKLGDAGKLYATWWRRAYKADAGENCLDAIGDVAAGLGAKSVQGMTDAVGNITNLAERFTESAALAYLSSMAHAPDVTNVDTGMASLTGQIVKIVLTRFLLLCVLSVILYMVLRQYVFSRILKVEEGNDRLTFDYVVVLLCACILAVTSRKYVYIAHSARIRNSLKKNVTGQLSGPLVEDFQKRFHPIDHSRFAI